MLLNYGVGEGSSESLGLQGDPTNRKGNQPWIFIGKTDAEAEIPIFLPPYAKSWLIWKDPDAGKDWGQEEKGMTEDEMVGWHHWLNGHGFGWTLGVGDGQGGLACCSSWGHKDSGTTEWLNWTVACGLVFDQGSKPGSWQWKFWVQTSRLLRNSLFFTFWLFTIYLHFLIEAQFPLVHELSMQED